MKKIYTLGREERLKSRKLIEQLFGNGRKFSVFPFRVQYMQLPAAIETLLPSALQVGVGVSARYFKKAVDRNKIKRLTREAWRTQKNTLKQKLTETNNRLVLFIIYTGKEIPDYLLVKEKLQLILDKLIQLIDENHPPFT